MVKTEDEKAVSGGVRWPVAWMCTIHLFLGRIVFCKSVTFLAKHIREFSLQNQWVFSSLRHVFAIYSFLRHSSDLESCPDKGPTLLHTVYTWFLLLGTRNPLVAKCVHIKQYGVILYVAGVGEISRLVDFRKYSNFPKPFQNSRTC